MVLKTSDKKAVVCFFTAESFNINFHVSFLFVFFIFYFFSDDDAIMIMLPLLHALLLRSLLKDSL